LIDFFELVFGKSLQRDKSIGLHIDLGGSIKGLDLRPVLLLVNNLLRRNFDPFTGDLEFGLQKIPTLVLCKHLVLSFVPDAILHLILWNLFYVYPLVIWSEFVPIELWYFTADHLLPCKG